MKLRIACKFTILLSLLIASKASAQIGESNPSQYAAMETGTSMINSSVKNQTSAMKKTGTLQAVMAAELTQMKSWEAKYNSYLKSTEGYAEQLKAGCNLYAEGVMTLRHIYEIQKACSANPEGIAASISMNNLYMEVVTEVTKTYRTLKKSISTGGPSNMLNGKQRTELLWAVNNNLCELNAKLRQLAISIAFYNLKDVWKKATVGMTDKSHGEIAAEAFDRWQRARRVNQILND